MPRKMKDKVIFRKIRTRAKLFGTPERPRLSVHRSLKHIYAQVIDDLSGKTIAAASTRQKGLEKGPGLKLAQQVGKLVAEKASAKGVKAVVFDRGPVNYHGRVKAVAEGAREAGLKF